MVIPGTDTIPLGLQRLVLQHTFVEDYPPYTPLVIERNNYVGVHAPYSEVYVRLLGGPNEIDIRSVVERVDVVPNTRMVLIRVPALNMV